MHNPFKVYEERRVVTKPGRFDDYLRLVRERVWPDLERAGAQTLVLLNGLIGAPDEETYMFTGFTDAAAWQQGQELITGVPVSGGPSNSPLRARADLIAEESVRLMIPSRYRPDPSPAVEDRRPVYGARRFFIDPKDREEFSRLSYEGVWPAVDDIGHYVLGQFHTAALTDPLEMLNLAGYHSAGHWYETRSVGDPSSGASAESREKRRTIGEQRRRLVKFSYVRLLTSHWPG